MATISSGQTCFPSWTLKKGLVRSKKTCDKFDFNLTLILIILHLIKDILIMSALCSFNILFFARQYTSLTHTINTLGYQVLNTNAPFHLDHPQSPAVLETLKGQGDPAVNY